MPPLTALRAFEMTARRRSVRLAAEALNVTPSAVSHQLRALEAALGVTLLRHVNRQLVLTEAGQILLPGIHDGFARIEAALAGLDAHSRTGALTVSMLSTFAAQWFIPRLPRFQKAHPEVEVHVSTGMRYVDLLRDGIDAAIRYGDGQWPGLRCERLMGETMLPVCSPALLRNGPPLDRPADLARHTLLLSEARPDDWRFWLADAGVPDLQSAHNMVFETTAFALEAALTGAGIAIVARELVAEALAQGRLIAPFDRIYVRPGAYFLVCAEARADEPKIAALRDWLMAEIAPAAELDGQLETVLRRLDRDARKPPQHVVAHMGQHQALRSDLPDVLHQSFIAQVKLHRLVVEISFRDEQVGVPRSRDQRVGPFGVAAIGDRLAAAGDAQRIGRCAAKMFDPERLDADAVPAPVRPVLEGVDRHVETPGHAGRSGEQAFHRLAEPLGERLRPDDRERALALAHELRIHQHENETGEMIAVQMADHHRIDAVRVDAELAHRDHRGGAAVDEEPRIPVFDQEAGVEPPAAAEGIAASEKAQLHRAPIP